MAGIFGGYGCVPEHYQQIKKHFESIWGKCESIDVPEGYLGGHAFSNDLALHVTREGHYFAVDGEHSLYKNAVIYAQKGEPLLFKWQDGRLEPGVLCKGNMAIVDQNRQAVYLLSEWTGSFPLYYTELGNGFLFSSQLRPLAKILNAAPDPVGISQFMKFGFMLAGRTFFKKIHRLLPGQVLTYQMESKQLRIHETSRAFRDQQGEIDFNEWVECSWTTLLNAMRRGLEFSHHPALFSSSGWDSRILLAVLRELNKMSSLLCYTHGDLKSRELKLAKKIYQKLAIQNHFEALDSQMFNLSEIKRGFDCTENVTFPHYLWAGERLAEKGIDCAIAGVLGEVVGGRHGFHWPMLPISEQEKISFVVPFLLNFPGKNDSKNGKDLADIYNILKPDNIRKPWYLKSDFWDSIGNIREEYYADMEEFTARLRKRGVENINKIAEAFTTEYFGSFYLTPQLLSSRTRINVTIPFADQEFYELTSKIPLSHKIVHTLQQAILKKYDSDLLRYPNAAAFLTSKFPIPVLEISRVIRKVYESISWKMCQVTRGRYKPDPTGWSTFSCLRQSTALLDIAEDLRNHLIDKNEIQRKIKIGLSRNGPDQSMYTWNASQNQLMKIYTTDLMLRYH